MASNSLEEREHRLRAGDEAWAELCAALDVALPDAPLHDRLAARGRQIRKTPSDGGLRQSRSGGGRTS